MLEPLKDGSMGVLTKESGMRNADFIVSPNRRDGTFSVAFTGGMTERAKEALRAVYAVYGKPSVGEEMIASLEEALSPAQRPAPRSFRIPLGSL